MIKITKQEILKERINSLHNVSSMQEQNYKNRIKKLLGIDDGLLDAICNSCKRKAKETNRTYLYYLQLVVALLSKGYKMDFICENVFRGESKNMNDYWKEQYIKLLIKNCEQLNQRICTGRDRLNGYKVVDVNIIVPDKVVEVTFADGTKEKSVCREPDIFSLETAISICISKKIMGGSSAYNNAVKRGIKVYEDKQKKKEAEKSEQERIEKKRAKRLAYKERRAAKRAEEEKQRKAIEREEQIAIQTEAYLRAMKAMDVSKNVVVNEENN